MTTRGARAVGAALFLVGCGSGPADTLGGTASAVNGPADSAGQYSMVVGLVTKKGQSLSRCSGALVAPNLVITARHCIAQGPGGFVTCGQAPLGDAVLPENVLVTSKAVQSDEPSDYVGVARIEVAPGGDDTCGFDLAALVLSGAGLGADAPTTTPRLDLPVQAGELVTAVGYGNTGSGSIGTRRFKAGVQVSCVGALCDPASVTDAEWVSEDDAFCQNDSGAAALDDQGRLVGTVSRGVNPCTTPVLASMPAWKSWLLEIGAEAAVEGGYQPPTWVSGLTPPPIDAGADAAPDSGPSKPTLSSSDDDAACALGVRRSGENNWLLSCVVLLMAAVTRRRSNRL
jgi:hypothetical protein